MFVNGKYFLYIIDECGDILILVSLGGVLILVLCIFVNVED